MAESMEGSFAADWLRAAMPAFVRRHPHWSRLEPWLVKLGTFFAGQGLVQGLSFLSSFFLLRWMNVKEYAVFTLAFSVQCMMASIVDLGFSGSIVALVGARVDDPKVVGGYMAAARWWRNHLMPPAFALGAVVFYILGSRQGWPLWLIAMLTVLTMAGVWLNVLGNLHIAPLLTRQRIGWIQWAQMLVAAVRLAGYGLGHLTGVLVGALVTAQNSALIGLTGLLYRREALTLAEEPAQSEPALRAEMRKFISPQLPTMIFYMFQGQIMVFLISLLGQTKNIAEVGALSRLQQLFAVLLPLITWIVGPYFAKIDHAIIGRRFVLLTVGMLAFVSVSGAVAYGVPEPFLWILGPNYRHLRAEVFWMVLSAAVAIVAAVYHNVAYYRRWITLGVTSAHIAVVTCAMAGTAALVDVSTALGVVQIGLAGAVAAVLIPVATCLRYARRAS